MTHIYDQTENLNFGTPDSVRIKNIFLKFISRLKIPDSFNPASCNPPFPLPLAWFTTLIAVPIALVWSTGLCSATRFCCGSVWPFTIQGSSRTFFAEGREFASNDNIDFNKFFARSEICLEFKIKLTPTLSEGIREYFLAWVILLKTFYS